MNLNPAERHTVFGVTIGTFFTWMSVYAVSQAMVQRYLTIPTIQGARTAIWLNLPGLSFLMLICAMAGLVMYARYYDCDPIMTKKVSSADQLLPLYVMDVLGKFTGLPGLFVAGIFSGALSTVSAGVNSLAAVTLEDVVKRYIVQDMSDRSSTTLTRILALTFGCTAIALVYVAQNMGNVLQAALAIFGIVGGPLLGVFTLGLFFPFANSIDIFYPYRISYVWYSMIACMLVVFVGIAVSLITGPYDPTKVDPRSIHPIYNWIVKKLTTPPRREKLMVRTVGNQALISGAIRALRRDVLKGRVTVCPYGKPSACRTKRSPNRTRWTRHFEQTRHKRRLRRRLLTSLEKAVGTDGPTSAN
ncbi:hypothetical protein MRX96_010108 [Rhipicephalus microplus]